MLKKGPGAKGKSVVVVSNDKYASLRLQLYDPLTRRSFKRQASEAERSGAVPAERRYPAALTSLTLDLHLGTAAVPIFACRSLAHNTTHSSPVPTTELAMARDKFARQSLGGTLHQRIKEVGAGTRNQKVQWWLTQPSHAS